MPRRTADGPPAAASTVCTACAATGEKSGVHGARRGEGEEEEKGMEGEVISVCALGGHWVGIE